MGQSCEVCAAAPAAGARTRRKLRRVLLGDRVLVLCAEHAAQVESSGAESLEAVRALFTEGAGQRSLIGRRDPLDRRVFPARPEGRRRGAGRRASDRVE